MATLKGLGEAKVSWNEQTLQGVGDIQMEESGVWPLVPSARGDQRSGIGHRPEEPKPEAQGSSVSFFYRLARANVRTARTLIRNARACVKVDPAYAERALIQAGSFLAAARTDRAMARASRKGS